MNVLVTAHHVKMVNATIVLAIIARVQTVIVKLLASLSE